MCPAYIYCAPRQVFYSKDGFLEDSVCVLWFFVASPLIEGTQNYLIKVINCNMIVNDYVKNKAFQNVEHAKIVIWVNGLSL
ncbi:MAG: hypothetical protein D6714_04635, partial [Bacteroidetes bacterium]